MSDYQITCVERNANLFDSNTLTAYGNPLLGWVINKVTAVAMASQGHTFFVQEAGVRANATVNGVYPLQYLRTNDDKVSANNLVNLPNCPGGLTRY